MIYYYNYIKPSSYQVIMNGNIIAYVKNVNRFEKENNEVFNEVNNRFGCYEYKDKVIYKKANVGKRYLTNSKLLKKEILQNSITDIPAFNMKADNNFIAVVANENEGNEIINAIKKYYKGDKQDSDIVVKNKITYEKTNLKLNELKDLTDIENDIIERNKIKEILSFSDNEMNLNGRVDDRMATVKNISRGETKKLLMQSSITFPVKGVVSSLFGLRWGKMHEGIDIACNTGTPIYSAFDGIVTYAGVESGYGNLINIASSNNIVVFYGHCSSINVNTKDIIHKGDLIGRVGSTGNSTGPHLHFEVRINGEAVDPSIYLK